MIITRIYRKIILISLLSTMALSNVSFARRHNTFYIGLKGSYTSISDLKDSQSQTISNPFGSGNADAKIEPTLKFKNEVVNGSFIVGNHFKNLRAEGEFSYLRVKLKSYSATRESDNRALSDLGLDSPGAFDSAFLLLNGYYDIAIFSKSFIPYVGVGLGASFAKIEVLTSINPENELKTKETIFAFQAMLGVQYFFTKNFSTILEYRFLGTSNFAFFEKDKLAQGFDKFKDNILSHALNAGIKLNIA